VDLMAEKIEAAIKALEPKTVEGDLGDVKVDEDFGNEESETVTTTTAPNAKTKDDRNIVLWILMLLMASGGFASTYLARRKED
jgi:hypothetical protein